MVDEQKAVHKVYNLINLEVDLNPWSHHYNLYHKHNHHLERFLQLFSWLLQPYFILLQFTLLYFADTVIFYKLKVCSNHALSKSISTIYPTTFAHFTSLCHILLILITLQTFSLLLFCNGDLWSVIFDVILVILEWSQTAPM